MALTARQRDTLIRPINRNRIARRSQSGKQLSYLEAWDVKAHLTRVFGFCNWDSRLVDYALLYDRPYTSHPKGKPEVEMREIAYQARVSLTIRDFDGGFLCEHTEAAVGSATVGADNAARADAYDNALKQAESDALKRCAINLGSQFGLSLYDKGNLGDVIRMTLYPGDDEPRDAPLTDEARQKLATSLDSTPVVESEQTASDIAFEVAEQEISHGG